MPGQAVECDYYTYLEMVHMNNSLKKLDAAMKEFQEMQNAGIRADYDMYMMLLRLAKYRKATYVGVKILKEMYDAGIVADEDAAYPFQEIVEDLPDYKPPPALVELKKNDHHIEKSTHLKRREEAKAQRKLMLETVPTTPLEKRRSYIMNFYNDDKFNPGNPHFERNYANRNAFKEDYIRKWPKHERERYRLAPTHETPALPAGDAILDGLFEEVQGRYIAEGRDKPTPRDTVLPDHKIKVK